MNGAAACHPSDLALPVGIRVVESRQASRLFFNAFIARMRIIFVIIPGFEGSDSTFKLSVSFSCISATTSHPETSSSSTRHSTYSWTVPGRIGVFVSFQVFQFSGNVYRRNFPWLSWFWWFSKNEKAPVVKLNKTEWALSKLQHIEYWNSRDKEVFFVYKYFFLHLNEVKIRLFWTSSITQWCKICRSIDAPVHPMLWKPYFPV